MKRIFIISMIVIVSCTQKRNKECEEETEFKRQFFNCLKIIESTMERPGTKPLTELVTTSDVVQAIKCLDAITKYQNHMKFENDVMYGVYESEIDLDNDKQNWMNWYNSHKCDYSIKMAEEDFRKARLPLPNYRSVHVMDSLKKIWIEYKGDTVRLQDSLFHVSMDAYWPRMVN